VPLGEHVGLMQAEAQQRKLFKDRPFRQLPSKAEDGIIMAHGIVGSRQMPLPEERTESQVPAV